LQLITNWNRDTINTGTGSKPAPNPNLHPTAIAAPALDQHGNKSTFNASTLPAAAKVAPQKARNS